ncbi:PREDICTED: uncharacterized protein LOC105577675 [Cercocebus atys]|uniref:uncharacterized protein LOC105577675 n=1 Tax=Cercocebus atys TaxID=9531 RepID=UPI0005F4FAF5|nr:PREDICTED: uncharacterized protein LOC105577675 [Cercocebus atys]
MTRAPPLPEAPAHSPAGGPKSAESRLEGGGAELAGSWKARETLFPPGRPDDRARAGGRGGAPHLGSTFFSCQYSKFTPLFCSAVSPVCEKGASALICLSPCDPGPFRLRYVVSRPRPTAPDYSSPGSASQFPVARARELSRLCVLAVGSPRGAPARARPSGTTFPSGLSGRRRCCGQVTRSPDRSE